ncbi:unnamed protein product [Rhizophagus irregularis]|nr:unnamed protein product [Rhizophagus irregularis]
MYRRIDEPLEYDPFAMDTEEINQDDEESEVAVFTRDTLIKDVRHTLVPIEYPATSDEGIAYVQSIIIDDEKDDNLTEINAIEIEEQKVSLEERKLKLKLYEIDLNTKNYK